MHLQDLAYVSYNVVVKKVLGFEVLLFLQGGPLVRNTRDKSLIVHTRQCDGLRLSLMGHDEFFHLVQLSLRNNISTKTSY